MIFKFRFHKIGSHYRINVYSSSTAKDPKLKFCGQLVIGAEDWNGCKAMHGLRIFGDDLEGDIDEPKVGFILEEDSE